jgi:hypothetical protein
MSTDGDVSWVREKVMKMKYCQPVFVGWEGISWENHGESMKNALWHRNLITTLEEDLRERSNLTLFSINFLLVFCTCSQSVDIENVSYQYRL